MHELRSILLVAIGLFGVASTLFLVWSKLVWKHFLNLGGKPVQSRLARSRPTGQSAQPQKPELISQARAEDLIRSH
jgi:hypothetical protein